MPLADNLAQSFKQQINLYLDGEYYGQLRLDAKDKPYFYIRSIRGEPYAFGLNGVRLGQMQKHIEVVSRSQSIKAESINLVLVTGLKGADSSLANKLKEEFASQAVLYQNDKFLVNAMVSTEDGKKVYFWPEGKKADQNLNVIMDGVLLFSHAFGQTLPEKGRKGVLYVDPLDGKSKKIDLTDKWSNFDVSAKGVTLNVQQKDILKTLFIKTGIMHAPGGFAMIGNKMIGAYDYNDGQLIVRDLYVTPPNQTPGDPKNYTMKVLTDGTVIKINAGSQSITPFEKKLIDFREDSVNQSVMPLTEDASVLMTLANPPGKKMLQTGGASDFKVSGESLTDRDLSFPKQLFMAYGLRQVPSVDKLFNMDGPLYGDVHRYNGQMFVLPVAMPDTLLKVMSSGQLYLATPGEQDLLKQPEIVHLYQSSIDEGLPMSRVPTGNDVYTRDGVYSNFTVNTIGFDTQEADFAKSLFIQSGIRKPIQETSLYNADGSVFAVASRYDERGMIRSFQTPDMVQTNQFMDLTVDGGTRAQFEPVHVVKDLTSAGMSSMDDMIPMSRMLSDEQILDQNFTISSTQRLELRASGFHSEAPDFTRVEQVMTPWAISFEENTPE